MSYDDEMRLLRLDMPLNMLIGLQGPLELTFTLTDNSEMKEKIEKNLKIEFLLPEYDASIYESTE